jgi:mannose/fructose/N-acetylgalactosamine-specific phosphotransferase system component IIC
MVLVESMRPLRSIGIVVSSIGFAILIIGTIIPSTIPDYNYYYYMGFRFPIWLALLASSMAMVGLILIKVKGKTK